MDSRLKRRIANDYPYPITVEFMRLNTMDYKNHGIERLRKIVDVTETLLQFMTLISISDLVENVINGKIKVSEDFKKAFKNNFTHISMGKWMSLLRESIKLFKSQGVEMFIEELPDYIIKSTSSESKVQVAFNRLITIRNSINHKTTQLSKTEVNKLSEEADSKLEFILKELDFIIDYQFLYINQVTVNYHRWSEPTYNIDMSYIVGSNPELFDSTDHDSSHRNIMHTPAIVITKENTKQYLNLEPLVIYSDEGEMEITDIFMYTDWDKSRNRIIYKPIWKGGNFNLLNTSIAKHIAPEMLKIMELLGVQSDFIGFKDQLDKRLN